MAYLTFNSLTQKTFLKAESINEDFTFRSNYQKSVFLSYRREDRQWVKDIVKFLKQFGVNVYIDYMDESLVDQASESVAATLRERIKSCDKFISLATPNSGKSKWMPWELGLGDRIINYKNVAILPLTEYSSTWNDQEYGNIYGKIENTTSFVGSHPLNWHIKYPDGRSVSIKDWFLN